MSRKGDSGFNCSYRKTNTLALRFIIAFVMVIMQNDNTVFAIGKVGARSRSKRVAGRGKGAQARLARFLRQTDRKRE